QDPEDQVDEDRRALAPHVFQHGTASSRTTSRRPQRLRLRVSLKKVRPPQDCLAPGRIYVITPHSFSDRVRDRFHFRRGAPGTGSSCSSIGSTECFPTTWPSTSGRPPHSRSSKDAASSRTSRAWSPCKHHRGAAPRRSSPSAKKPRRCSAARRATSSRSGR